MAYFGCIKKSAGSNYLYKWDFTKSLIDEVEGKEVTLARGAVRTSNGVELTGIGHRINFTLPTHDFLLNKTIELDIVKFDFKGNSNYDMNFIVQESAKTTATGYLEYFSNKGWKVYGYNAIRSDTLKESSIFSSDLDRNAFNGKTIKLKITRPTSGYDLFELYLDNVFVGRVNDVYFPSANAKNNFSIGSRNQNTATNGDQCYDVIISGFRIYANEEV